MKKKRDLILILGFLLVAAGSVCCGSAQTESPISHSRLDPHTVSRIVSVEQFSTLAAKSSGKLVSVKFIVTDFQKTRSRSVLFMDGRFYTYHDEWYWFLRLNGSRVLGHPPMGESPGCATPEACTLWVRGLDVKPIGLSFVEERMYSSQFYDLALAKRRTLGLGALVYVPGRKKEKAQFGFRLEYVDRPNAKEINTFFSTLSEALPSSIANELKWITRSPYQEQLAQKMISTKRLKRNQVVSYSAFAVEGEAEIYNNGLAVGRLLFVDKGTSAIASSDSSRILVVERLPDELPPAAGLISAVPQTPLSHVNILARNRGIPSVYIGGVFQSDYIKQLEDGNAPVAVWADGGEVRITEITEAEYKRFSNVPMTFRTNPVATFESAPYTFSLPELNASKRDDLASLIGGKAAGLWMLYRAIPKEIPKDVGIITTRAYHEHLQPMEKELDAVINHSVFQDSAKIRFFVLEGRDAYHRTFSKVSDNDIVQGLKKRSPMLYKLGDEGGIKAKIRRRKMDPLVLAEITRILHHPLGDYSETQGIRFRSSSTVEDVDGFNGAGLYVSSTGFLSPEKLETPKKKSHTVEWAIKKTWASYWNFQAFEERRNFGIDHISGKMGVLVHGRFDDDRELANGVVTMTSFPKNHSHVLRMEVNAQQGALSVTNPPSHLNALPETVVVTLLSGQAAPVIERVRRSVIDAVESDVLNDDELLRLFEANKKVITLWQKDHDNGKSTSTRRQSTTLDFEFRKMAVEWFDPRGKNGGGKSSIVLKQVRSLEPVAVISDILEMGFDAPRDILQQAALVERSACANADHQVAFLEITTVPEARPNLGYHLFPFVADLQVVVGNRLQVMAPSDYLQPGGELTVVFTPEAQKRIGVEELPLKDMVCHKKVMAAAQTLSLREVAKRGKRIGQVTNKGIH